MHLPKSSAVAVMFAATFALSAVTSSHAQALSDVPADSRVRIVIADSLRQGPIFPTRQRVVGVLVRTTTDSVTLRLMGSGHFSIARSTIKGAQVSRGVSRGRSAVTFGIATGLLGALVVYNDGPKGGSHQTQNMLAGGGLGFGVGALIGALSPFETWRRIRK